MSDSKKNQSAIDVQLQAIDQKVELFKMAEEIRVLSYAMIDVCRDDLPDRAILHSMIIERLKPYLPEEDFKP